MLNGIGSLYIKFVLNVNILCGGFLLSFYYIIRTFSGTILVSKLQTLAVAFLVTSKVVDENVVGHSHR